MLWNIYLERILDDVHGNRPGPVGGVDQVIAMSGPSGILLVVDGRFRGYLLLVGHGERDRGAAMRYREKVSTAGPEGSPGLSLALQWSLLGYVARVVLVGLSGASLLCDCRVSGVSYRACKD